MLCIWSWFVFYVWKVNFIFKIFYNVMFVYVLVCKYYYDIKCDIFC